MLEGLVCDAGGPRHVLIAAVGAASNQTCRDTVNTNSVRALIPAAQRYWVCLLAIMIMITVSLVVTWKNQKRNSVCVCVCACRVCVCVRVVCVCVRACVRASQDK